LKFEFTAETQSAPRFFKYELLGVLGVSAVKKT
jgi:hypothetical protein